MGHTSEEELERLGQVFERLACAGLKLKPKKCFLFQKRVSCLGHVVTEEGITADSGKVERVRIWPIAGNSTEVKSFLGLAFYYRRFIPDFSMIAHPLYKLTEAKAEFVWTEQCQLAFDSLKGLLMSGRVLAYPTRDGMHRTMGWALRCHRFRMGWRNQLRLLVKHCLSLKGTIA